MGQRSVDEILKQKMVEAQHRALGEQMELLEKLKQEFGQPLVEAVERHYGMRAKTRYAEKAAGLPERDIDTLIKILFEPAKAAGIEYVVNEREDGVEFCVTRCPWHENVKAVQEFARDADALSWGYRMFCCTDPYITEGFNPDWTFSRTKTLMQGHDCCTHYYHFERTRSNGCSVPS